MVTLRNYKSEDFRIYTRFLYTGLVFMVKANDNQDVEDHAIHRYHIRCPEIDRWRCVYLLSDYLQAPNSRDALLNALMETGSIIVIAPHSDS